ncbi:MAG: histidinol dehydrogenase, partial [Methanoregulaceae archaeon]|nr:histidinol dehydrogenase [Methanoregulaceae archaeon]
MWKEVRVDTWINNRTSSLEGVRENVTDIIGRVRKDGDAALRAMSRHVVLEEVAISEKEIAAAYETVDGKVVESLVKAEERIRRFHELQRPRNLWLDTIEPGIVLGVKTTPLNRVGIYVPGGRAAYPSTALMCAVPARVAGVREICACSPPPIKPLTLVALDIA